MYCQSKNVGNIRIAIRRTRGADKIVFSLPTKCSGKYLRNPYYIGTQLWNNLPEDTQRSENMFQFAKKITPMYKLYKKNPV